MPQNDRPGSNDHELAAAVPAAAGGSGGGESAPPTIVQLQSPQPSTTHPSRFFGVDIREATRRVSFNALDAFLKDLFCGDKDSDQLPPAVRKAANESFAHYTKGHLHGVHAYQLLKSATEMFLIMNCGVFRLSGQRGDQFYARQPEATLADDRRRLNEPALTVAQIIEGLRTFLGGRIDTLSTLPYFERVVSNGALRGQKLVDSPLCEGVLAGRVAREEAPCLLELIWSYWHEQGALVQGINMVALRFQNRLDPSGQNPLANLNLDPLRPMSSVLWGYLQDEYSRLTIQRRAYEYDHHYGLTLYGKAVQPLRSADSRSKFIEAFHNLLHRTSGFYKQDDDLTVRADGFPVLQALKEVHLLLTEGMHNQFGDLPWTARVEMLVQQWILARPEISQFLNSRPMVPYTEPWMAQVDTLKKLFSWHDTSVTHFRDLGVFGEQLLLSIRYYLWLDENSQDAAIDWARQWRPEVQSYIHAYRAVTGVDLLIAPVNTTPPSILLRDRLAGRPAAAV